MDIRGTVALVTGGAIGTGRAIVLALVAAGAEVVACDIDAAGVQETATLAPEGRCRAETVDVTGPDEMGRLVREVRPQILVNNAGGGGHIPPHFPDAPREHWQRVITLNLLAPMWATQEALRTASPSRQVAVINVASTAGLGLEPYQSPEYGAAKAGLVRFTATLSGWPGARVNCLVPDWVATERVTETERATVPPPVPLTSVTAGVLRLITDDSLSGRILVLYRGQAPRLLDRLPVAY